VARCAGILLTGGRARRLGADKASLVLDGETLGARAARVLGEVCDPVVEVGPGRSPLPCIREEPPGSGPLAALAAGLAWVRARGHAGPALLLAVDLPRVGAPLLRLLADEPGDHTVVPVADGRPQPVCARYGPETLETARELLDGGRRALRDLVARLAWEPPGPAGWAGVGADAFDDVDSPDDARRLGIGWAPGVGSAAS